MEQHSDGGDGPGRRFGGRLAALVGVLVLALGIGATAVWALNDDDGGSGASGSDATSEDGHDHDHGNGDGAEHANGEIAVHDSTGGEEPNAEDEAAADEFYDDVADATQRYTDIDVAIADGYAETSPDADGSGPVKHYMMRRGGDGAELDPEHPEGLVYYVDDDQATLIGIVFVSRADEPEQPAGPLTVWHDHSPGGCPETKPDCPAADGTAGDHPPKMLHVWLYEGADRFAHGFPESLPDGHERGEPLPFDV